MLTWYDFVQQSGIVHWIRWWITWDDLAPADCVISPMENVSCAHLNMCHFCTSTYVHHLCMLPLAASRASTGTPKLLTSWTGWGDCDLLSSRRSRVDRTFRLHLTPVYLTSCTTQLLANSSNQFTHMRDNEPLPCHSLLHVSDAVSGASGVRRTYIGWLVGMQHFVCGVWFQMVLNPPRFVSCQVSPRWICDLVRGFLHALFTCVLVPVGQSRWEGLNDVFD